MSRKTISVAITDDHQIVIDGITALLNGHPNIRIIHTSVSGTNMLQMLHQQAVDVLLTDIMMPEMTGQELAKAVRKGFPETRILALSMSGQGDIVNEMINEADIAGYVLKNISKQDLIAAIEKVAAGGIYFSEEVLNELARFDQVTKENETVQLTAREIEIIRLIEKELSNKAIAEQLYISERTVETHRKNIFRKTNASSVLGLIKYAYQHKLIQS
jgi:two-component system, NarL family, nitrate/nitrite response regulator NarL